MQQQGIKARGGGKNVHSPKICNFFKFPRHLLLRCQQVKLVERACRVGGRLGCHRQLRNRWINFVEPAMSPCSDVSERYCTVVRTGVLP